ncbi:phosphatidylserine decarboxylase [Amycolatopsis sp. NPDC059027]|uniref:phosphatidylserine decarboxylase n=1 Tax=unclassified Amycolatopsis TaxID=2618356 RepID=UPI00366E132F
MAKSLEEWIETDVRAVQDKSLSWLSQYYFFRDPTRPAYIDPYYFFSPADGVILYQEVVEPGDCLVDIKGKPYSLRDALRDPSYDRTSLVIGIFMTFFDVHVNRVPYSGRLSYRELDSIDTLNLPMLAVEKELVEELRIATGDAEYLHNNQRVVNRFDNADLNGPYYVLQIADYDVDSITPFELKQNQPVSQGDRFSQIRYGSQVDLVIPVSDRYDLTPLQRTGDHVEGGVDPLVRITDRDTSEAEGAAR